MLHPPAFAAPALLHTAARIEWSSFTVHASTVVGLAGLAAVYEWCAVRAGRSAHRVFFYSGLAVIFFALNGWLHDLSDYYLFSAHMVQHLLLTLVAPPLLIAGTPGWMLRPALGWPVAAAAARWITRPAHCFATFNLVLATWHLPPVYNLAMAHHWAHIVQHLMFIAAAVLMWWPVMSPLPELPRLSYPAQMLYCFVLSIPMSLISVYIAYADALLYTAYAAAPRLWGITPLQDQLIGGLIMWIPGGLFFFGVMSVVYWKWQAHDGDETVAGAQAVEAGAGSA
ncbi:MAG: cytochrome c oxidase assembly protein [Gemmatimonadaceae bacterium]